MSVPQIGAPEVWQAGYDGPGVDPTDRGPSGEGAIAARLVEMYARAEHEVCLSALRRTSPRQHRR
ncbi:hypothetical protein ABT075_37555 [Streptomyces sp. NPDC002677]|uniref:hypothetical protein n=1 Tax=Streptomyces sp. NPDC002677 TaxID=3154774 RepID=UPI003322FB03